MLRTRTLIFRQDYRINKIFLSLSRPRERCRKAQSVIPLQGKAFTHCAKRSKSRITFSWFHREAMKNNQVNPVNPVRKHFGFIWIKNMNNYPIIYPILSNLNFKSCERSRTGDGVLYRQGASNEPEPRKKTFAKSDRNRETCFSWKKTGCILYFCHKPNVSSIKKS